MEITTLYERVFDEDGNIKPCGRKKCIDLIMALEQATNIPCGDKNTGYMSVENIKRAYTQYIINSRTNP